MQIEEGRSYKTRSGEKRGPMRPYRAKLYADYYTWTDAAQDDDVRARNLWISDGAFLRDCIDDRDLIALWDEPQTGPVRTVTRKEIVAGTYGEIRIHPGQDLPYVTLVGDYINCTPDNAAKFRAAAVAFTAIAEALDEAKP